MRPEGATALLPLMSPAAAPSSAPATAVPATGPRLSDVLAALSVALDVAEGQPEGHAVRSCLIGMRLAQVIGLDVEQRSNLLYALLLKDLGGSSSAAPLARFLGADDIAAKRDLATLDWTRFAPRLGFVARHVAPAASGWRRALRVASAALRGARHARQGTALRCERGAFLAADIGLSPATAEAIRALDEHWDGRGYPLGLAGDDIPLLARIACLAQTVEVFAAAHGPLAALAMAQQRSGTWFDPRLVTVLGTFVGDVGFWDFVAHDALTPELARLEPREAVLVADEDALDRVAAAFAQAIDAKSPWTRRHSERTAEIAVRLASGFGLGPDEVRHLRRAALLHDLGKLGVSNLILDASDPLTDPERADVRRHPERTRRILERVPGFQGVACCAGNHHERLDGQGYPRGLSGQDLPLPDRILAVADVYEALSADRPHRPGWPHERIVQHLAHGGSGHLCPECVDQVRNVLSPVLSPARS